jgi:hypothetical protein
MHYTRGEKIEEHTRGHISVRTRRKSKNQVSAEWGHGPINNQVST